MVVFCKMETHIVKSRASFQHTSKSQVQKTGHKKEVGCLSLRPMLAAERVPVTPCLSWDFLQEQQHPSHTTYLLVQEIPGIQLTGPGDQQQVGVNCVFKNMWCSLVWFLKLTWPGQNTEMPTQCFPWHGKPEPNRGSPDPSLGSGWQEEAMFLGSMSIIH